jgi:hypothetical protein
MVTIKFNEFNNTYKPLGGKGLKELIVVFK